MPSPFPGIDPYLEAQGYWGDFHPRFVTYLCDALNDILPKSYVAQLGEQVRLVDLTIRESKRIIPDVAILGEKRRTRLTCRASEAGGGDSDARAGDDPVTSREDGGPRRLDRDPPPSQEGTGFGDRGALTDQ